MALKSDAYGFLVGAPVEWGRALQIFNEIRDEVRALRGDIAAGASIKALERAADAVSRQAQAVTRTSSSKAALRLATPPRPQAPARAPKPSAVAPTRAAPVRGPNGRFVSASSTSVAPATPKRAAPARGPGGRFVSAAAAKAATASASPRQVAQSSAKPSGGIHIIDRSSLGNRKDADAFSDETRATVKKALADGKTVHYVIEGKRHQIVSADAGRLKDAKGQQWGMTPLLMPAFGDHARLEIQGGSAVPSIRQPYQIPVSADAGSAVPAPVATVRTQAEVKAAVAAQNAAMAAARPAPLGSGTKGKPATPNRRGSLTPEQRAGDREADRAAREQERSASKHAKALEAQNRYNKRVQAKIDREKEKEAARPGLASHAYKAIGDAPEIDPSIAALHEVQAAVAPVGRGLGLLFGSSKKGPLGRLFGTKGATPFEKAELKVLTQIRDNTNGGGGKGAGGILGGILGALPGVGGLGRLLGGAGGLARLALRGGGGLFRRIPLLGALLSAGSAVASMAGVGDDPNATPEQNQEKRFTGAGSGIGALVGGGLGTLVAGPVGAVVGGVIGDKVGEFLGKRLAKSDWAKPIAKAVSDAKDWVLGKTSQFFESGKRGAAAISSGRGDHGGASYGTYQLASAGGAKSTLNKFLAASGYASQFAGMTPGSPEFNAKWKQIAASDPAFGTAQHDFIKSTHFDPQMALLGKSGIDLSKRGAAVQDAVWSTSVQFGGQTSLIKSALAGKDTSKMSDAEIVTAIQNYKIAHNSDLFRSSSAATQASTLNRASVERSRLLALAAPLPSPSTTPGINVPVVADAAPSVPTSLGKPPAVEVRVSKDAGDVGPTVSDPKIARLVSGGLSN